MTKYPFLSDNVRKTFKMSAGALAGGLWLVSPLAMAEEADHREHGAHEHGAAMLTVVIEDNMLEMVFSAPAANIVGFEQVPHDDAQRNAVAEAVSQLKQAEVLFGLPAEADCQLDHVEIESALLEQEGHQDHAHEEERHADFDVSYRYNCQATEKLDSIDVNIFTAFPHNQHIEVQYITSAGQGMQALEAGNSRIKF